MIRTLSVATTILLAALARPALAARGAAKAPAVKGAQPVRLEHPASFYRDAALVEAVDLVVLRVAIDDPMELAPRAMPALLFLYGHALCEYLTPSGSERELLLLCPKPPPAEP